mmetsp:Transcript_3414/g.7677  ORF Transcript_3414/g.7677 Transcript_3414/m.7677 type:complete len:216 (+) Transcript_3414:338-985(+)
MMASAYRRSPAQFFMASPIAHTSSELRGTRSVYRPADSTGALSSHAKCRMERRAASSAARSSSSRAKRTRGGSSAAPGMRRNSSRSAMYRPGALSSSRRLANSSSSKLPRKRMRYLGANSRPAPWPCRRLVAAHPSRRTMRSRASAPRTLAKSRLRYAVRCSSNGVGSSAWNGDCDGGMEARLSAAAASIAASQCIVWASRTLNLPRPGRKSARP